MIRFIFDILKRFTSKQGNVVTKDEAIKIATKYLNDKGVSDIEPVSCDLRQKVYIFTTRVNMRGGNTIIQISSETGKVIKEFICSR
jgi:hypothetical protein